MDIPSLLNHTPTIHSTPLAQRFYLINSLRDTHRRSYSPPESHPRKPHSAPLTRDDKIRIRTLRQDCKWTYQQIAQTTGKTFRQVQDALRGDLTPRKKGPKVGTKRRPRGDDGGELLRFQRPIVLNLSGNVVPFQNFNKTGEDTLEADISPSPLPSPPPSPSPSPHIQIKQEL